MYNLTNHVTAKLKQAEVQYFPFQHLIIDNIFTEAIYNEITVNKVPDNVIPSLRDVRVVPKGYSLARKAFSLISNQDMIPEASVDFWVRLTKWFQEDFTELVVSKFNVTKKFSVDLLYSRDHEGYQLGPHTDKPSKILTFLFYIPSQATNPKFGTTIFVPKKVGFSCNGSRHHDFESFNIYNSIEYVPNRAFGFVKNSRSFHGVLPIDKPCERDLLIYDLQLTK